MLNKYVNCIIRYIQYTQYIQYIIQLIRNVINLNLPFCRINENIVTSQRFQVI